VTISGINNYFKSLVENERAKESFVICAEQIKYGEVGEKLEGWGKSGLARIKIKLLYGLERYSWAK
jgi:gamma-glutamylcysteine synthetase